MLTYSPCIGWALSFTKPSALSGISSCYWEAAFSRNYPFTKETLNHLKKNLNISTKKNSRCQINTNAYKYLLREKDD